MRLPNFFIVGAPRCGTTSLSEYLREHPEVSFSKPKEPHFFSNDLSSAYRLVRTWKEYKKAFDEKSSSYQIAGEGSVLYLYSDVAVPEILKWNPKAKFIVMLRNPIAMAYSLHAQNVFAGDEDIEDFEAAWRLRKDRRKGEHIPKACKEPALLLYDEICSIGSQTERLLELVPREQVLAIFFDEFTKDPKKVYEQVLMFLGLSPDGRSHFPQHNQRRKVRSHQLVKVIRMIKKLTSTTLAKRGMRLVKRVLNIDRIGIVPALRQLAIPTKKRKDIPPVLEAELSEHFAQEVRKIEKIRNSMRGSPYLHK